MKSDLLKLLTQHRTIRKFLPVALGESVISECVAAAQMAASSSNVQGYSLLQVKDSAVRGALAECCGGQAQITEAGAFFVVCADQKRHRLLAEDHGVPYQPNLETFLTGTIDASIFAQNLVIAFESQGLGTCYIGGLRDDLRQASQLLEVPEDVFPLFGLCVGEIDDPGETKPRLAINSVLFTDGYPNDEKLRKQIAEYDERMGKYYTERGLPNRNWSGGVQRKFVRRSREAVFGYYESQGARLRP